jgi:endoglucanase
VVLTRRAFLKAAAATAIAAPLIEACSVASKTKPSPSPTPTSQLWLRAAGGKLVDGTGREVCLTGVSWFGLETSIFAPHGLWSRRLEDMLDQIVESGFNLLRLPFCNQVLDDGRMPSSIDFTKNPDLRDLTSLELMDRVIEGAAARRVRVLLDRHRPTSEAQSELWYTGAIPETRWIRDWVFLARRYRDQPAVVGADLHNEPHGAASWGDGNAATDWRLAAERAGDAILEANPEWLIVVEGIERYGGDSYWWGGNLRGARAYPVRLVRQDKLVYSAHDYGPGVYPQPWFHAPDFPKNLPSVWTGHWAGVQGDGVAPVLMGEFGGRSVGADPEGVWQRTLVGFLKEHRISYAYWSWNPDSGDTGGILKDDWQTIDRAKLDMLATYQCGRP